MDKRRIYGEKTEINTSHVRDFYNRRAAASSGGDVGAVLLGKHDTRLLNKRNDYDRNYVLPMLEIGNNTRVLDIGCGIGRWAGFIFSAQHCRFYCGVDFSPEMVRITEGVCKNLGCSYACHCMTALEAASKTPAFYGGRFGAVIIGGVFAYINDSDAEQIFRRLPELLEEHCVIYLAEPVGLEKRLTLKDFPSEGLQAEYSAIYRTVKEYEELYAPLLAAGFTIAKQEFRPDCGDNYSDTSRYHFILKR